jgi:hypothetical protein
MTTALTKAILAGLKWAVYAPPQRGARAVLVRYDSLAAADRYRSRLGARGIECWIEECGYRLAEPMSAPFGG